MTPRRIVGATAAILLSGGAHLVGSGWFTPNRIELEGGGEPIPARLGNSFADMVAGMPGSERPDVTDPVEVEADTVAPNQAEPTAPNEVDPADAEVADARDSEQPLVDAPAISATPSTIAAIPASPVETAPVEPTTSAATAVVETARPETSQAVAETDAQILTPLSSPRPSVRPDGLAPPPPPPQSVQPQVAAPQPQPQPPAVTGGGSTKPARRTQPHLLLSNPHRNRATRLPLQITQVRSCNRSRARAAHVCAITGPTRSLRFESHRMGSLRA